MTKTQAQVFIGSYVAVAIVGCAVVLITGETRFVMLLLIALLSYPPMAAYLAAPDIETLDTSDLDGYVSGILSVLSATSPQTQPKERMPELALALLDYGFELHFSMVNDNEIITHAIENKADLDRDLSSWIEIAEHGDFIAAYKYLGSYITITIPFAACESGQWMIEGDIRGSYYLTRADG